MLEEKIENAYWAFDAMRKGVHPLEYRKGFSERDNFKTAVRNHISEQHGALESALNEQEGGDHYKKMGQYQPWEVFHKWLTPEELKGFMKGTVIAYLAREDEKGKRLDIEKAKHTLELYLELTKDDAP
jgi:hypothetical protein